MEPTNQKFLERVVSQKALQMGSSFPCQICVVGFLCGVCLTSLFLAVLTSVGTFGFTGVSFSSLSMGNSPLNSSSEIINVITSSDYQSKVKETARWVDSKGREPESDDDERVSLLTEAWGALLADREPEESEFSKRFGLSKSSLPNTPHLENCKLSAQVNKRLDTRSGAGRFPPWTTWKGSLNMYPATETDENLRSFKDQPVSDGAYPPWIVGSDEENYPLTRKVQSDIWIHQHPVNCHDPNIKFLVADWEKLPGFGIGAQLAGMAGLLAIAINEKRVLVTGYFNRADHDGCKASRGSWSCYFFLETSQECRDRAFELITNKEAWEMGTIKGKDSYKSKEIWTAKVPRVWGYPWSYLQPTTDINGSLIAVHHKMDRRWWRAQAVRYLMRCQTEYTCGLLNVARHAAFGKEAAKMVLASIDRDWPKVITNQPKSEIEEFVWSNHRPWVPRPLLSMHVRMGDKACEMKVVKFEEYMELAHRIQMHFPHLKNVWLSTEMQEVIDKTRSYPHWNFYYTNVTRQVGNVSMATYEASLGRKTSTNYPLVNFLMAVDSDFFIGALGSTWCFLIDGMRNTGGKVMAGYLSVNKDRFW
ncbi:hypothetical protein E1A91_D11G286800v1 [Gossypium mustelinum]|uniref:Alpha-(1,6)-fucosyltransferase n=1 Tax=Gossypium mustelinum TaxID=34275 RepID=A0A5D2SYK5_GOSMU|nr:hypothetical protein E1A91_D11G286800v1 [Gossypium mustelinum]TYI57517.1 hypothetical protein E1A91_D11G286800v1 [Gossypium mustelinum]